MFEFYADFQNGNDLNSGDTAGAVDLTGNDGDGDGANGFVSATGGFTGMEGRYIHIQFGTPVLCTIDTVTNDTTVVLSCAGANEDPVDFRIGGEFKTIAKGVQMIPVVEGGSRLNVENDGAAMVQTLAASITTAIHRGGRSGLVIQGYSATINDGVLAKVDGDSAVNDCFDINHQGHHIVDMEIYGCNEEAINMGSDGADWSSIFRNYIHNTGDNGIYVQNGTAQRIFNNEITSTTTYAMNVYSPAIIRYNYIHDVSDNGVRFGSSISDFSYNIIDTAGDDCIDIISDQITIDSNTIYNCSGDGINYFNSTLEGTVITNNIIDTVTGLTIDGNDSYTLMIANNLLYPDGGSARDGIYKLDFGGEVTSDPSLNNSTFQAAGGDDLGFPIYFDSPSGGSTVPGHIDIGATSYEETAGGGGGATGFLLAF